MGGQRQAEAPWPGCRGTRPMAPANPAQSSPCICFSPSSSQGALTLPAGLMVQQGEGSQWLPGLLDGWGHGQLLSQQSPDASGGLGVGAGRRRLWTRSWCLLGAPPCPGKRPQRGYLPLLLPLPQPGPQQVSGVQCRSSSLTSRPLSSLLGPCPHAHTRSAGSGALVLGQRSPNGNDTATRVITRCPCACQRSTSITPTSWQPERTGLSPSSREWKNAQSRE